MGMSELFMLRSDKISLVRAITEACVSPGREEGQRRPAREDGCREGKDREGDRQESYVVRARKEVSWRRRRFV